jgi:hypothetical protein
MTRWTWAHEQLRSALQKTVRATAVRYVRASCKLVIASRSGIVVSIPVGLLRCFDGTSDQQLAGEETGRWSIWVNGNWRLTFEFQEGHAYVLDYEDCH